MRKVLRADPKNMIFPTVLCGALWSLDAWIAFAQDKYMDAGKMALCTLFLYGLLYLLFMRHRLEVTDEELVASSIFARTQRVKWSDIVETQLSISKRNPISLEIYNRSPTERTKPLALIAIKPFKAEDIRWLLQYPPLKLDH